MPCSLSTTADEAAAATASGTGVSASRVIRPQRNGYATLMNCLVEPLVVEGAFERVELLPELPGVGSHDAGIEGLAVAPALEQGEMVRAAILLQHVEPQIAAILAAGIGQYLDELDGLVLPGREDVDMGEDIERLRPGPSGRGRDGEAGECSYPGPADQHRLHLVAVSGLQRRGGMRLVGLLVAPGFENREPV